VESPVSHKQTKRTFVSAISSQPEQQEEFLWLQEQAIGAASLSGVQSKLPFLFGRASCPKCMHEFPLFKELITQAA
jgi:hypothetical protein